MGILHQDHSKFYSPPDRGGPRSLFGPGLFLEPFQPKPGLCADVFGRGAAKTGAAAHRVFDSENRENILADARLDGLHFGEGEFFKRLFLRRRDGNEAAGDVVRLAKRQF